MDAQYSSKAKNTLLLFLAMVLGYVSWVAPPMLIPGSERLKWPLSPEFMTDGTQVRFYMAMCLLGVGLLLGFLDPRRGSLWGAATGLPMVIFSALEAALGLQSHNLFGIEVFMYAIFSIPAIIGGWIGGRLKSLRKLPLK